MTPPDFDVRGALRAGAHDAGAVPRAGEGVAVELESFEARKGLPSRAKPGERYVGITVEHRVLGELPDC